MQSRSDMDNPARVTAAVLGVVLIAATIPYFIFSGGGEGATTYTVSWNQATAGSGSQGIAATPAGGPTPQELDVPVRDQRVSNATVEIENCNDTAVNPVQADAVLTFTLLYENSTAKDADGQDISGQATCDSPGPFTFELGGHPDVGSTDADSTAQALENAYGRSGNRTGTYTVQFSWMRPAGSGPPLPLPGQAVFTGTVALEIQSWRATANQQGQEAPR